MTMKKRINGFLNVTCTSFTIVALIYTLLANSIGADLTERSILSLFAVCAAVGAVIFITDFIPVQSLILRLGIDFIDVTATVFLFGGVVLRLFPFDAGIILIVFGMLTAAFAGAAALAIANERISSDAINQKIAEMKGRN